MTLRLVLTPVKAELPVGAPPAFKAALKNDSDESVRICTYMLHHRLLGGMSAVDAEGLEYGLFPFKTGRWLRFKPADVRPLGPKRALADQLVLAQEPNWGFVRTGSMPPVVSRSYIQPYFPAGPVRFSTLLADRISLYVGRDGVYDFSWQQRRLPSDVPGADAVDFSKVTLDLIEAQTTITFV